MDALAAIGLSFIETAAEKAKTAIEMSVLVQGSETML
ncbi:unannotated protein [freshwater metagenome]|uniref:Unannotated protein n=1 Tax=freshwater metagenome TaxID=449393 RepID=A0A6J6BV20_9ZZZZ